MVSNNNRLGRLFTVAIPSMLVAIIVLVLWLVFVHIPSQENTDTTEATTELVTETPAKKTTTGLGSSGILATIDKFQDASPGTFIMYDYIEGGWESSGQLLLVISYNNDEEKITGVTTKGEKVTISTKRVKYIYDPMKIADEYTYTAHAFCAQLAKSYQE